MRMKRYWAHIVISDTDEWEGDVIMADEVDAELKKRDGVISRHANCMIRAGMGAFIKNGTPEQIAEHYEKIAKNNLIADAEKNKLLAIAKKALEFYADDETHFPTEDEFIRPIDADVGAIAREALEQMEGK